MGNTCASGLSHAHPVSDKVGNDVIGHLAVREDGVARDTAAEEWLRRLGLEVYGGAFKVAGYLDDVSRLQASSLSSLPAAHGHTACYKLGLARRLHHRPCLSTTWLALSAWHACPSWHPTGACCWTQR